jgi:hypothetical protein
MSEKANSNAHGAPQPNSAALSQRGPAVNGIHEVRGWALPGSQCGVRPLRILLQRFIILALSYPDILFSYWAAVGIQAFPQNKEVSTAFSTEPVEIWPYEFC